MKSFFCKIIAVFLSICTMFVLGALLVFAEVKVRFYHFEFLRRFISKNVRKRCCIMNKILKKAKSTVYIKEHGITLK